MKNYYFILLAILEPWVEYCSHIFLDIFCSTSFCKQRGQFPLLIACVLAPSSCGVRRAWLQRDVRKGMLVHKYIARPGVGKEMVNRCVAAGCSNTPSDRVSLFKFPSDGVLRRKWEKQVQQTRAQWKATEHSFLCSDHFTEDCFEVDSALASQFEMKKRRRLKPGAVPTIFHRPSTAPVCTNEAEEIFMQKDSWCMSHGW